MSLASRFRLSKMARKMHVVWDYAVLVIARPGLLKEAAKTIIHHKPNRLANKLQAVNVIESKPEKAVPNVSHVVTERASYSGILLQSGSYSLSRTPSESLSYARAAERHVDVVYTWVNHKDPDWARLYQNHKPAAARQNLTDTGDHISNDSQAIARFHSVDELRFSLRSVAKNLPWVRKIHVFTNCAIPDWLRKTHPKIYWVDHTKVIPEEYLPTFSSHVIESFLHHIPDLADQFLYLNDDFFVARPLDKNFFFSANGLSRSFLESYGMVSGPLRVGDPDYLNAARNSARLIHQAFGVVPTQLHKHTPYALRRDVLQEIEDRWRPEFHSFRQNRFRMINDLNMTSFLYHHYAMNTERAIDATVEDALIKQMDVRWKNRLSNAMNGKIQMICINEGGSGKPSWDWHKCVLKFLKSSYPIKADWER